MERVQQELKIKLKHTQLDNLQIPSSLYFPAYDYAYAQGHGQGSPPMVQVRFQSVISQLFQHTPKRIIRCGGAVDDDMANIIVAQLLYLETSFAWLEIMSHRSFMPKLLIVNRPKGWPHVQRLLVDLFKFMEPYLCSAELGETIHVLFKGILRVLLVLFHDFPEFLCDYHFSFCDVIPSNCIQMRNVILSAFYLDCIFFRKELFPSV